MVVDAFLLKLKLQDNISKLVNINNNSITVNNNNIDNNLVIDIIQNLLSICKTYPEF